MSEYEQVTIKGRTRPAHDVVAERKLGRPLAKDEVVHHINGDKRDNREENLEVMKRAEHTALHTSGKVFMPESIEKMKEAHVGTRSARRSLTDEQVLEIVRKLQEGMSAQKLGKIYKVSTKAITRIRDGKSYCDVTSRIPGIEFPLQKHKKNTIKPERRKLGFWDVMDIRVRILFGESLQSIAKLHGVSRTVIADISEGKSYNDIPWPEEVGRYPVITDMKRLVDMMLDHPLSKNENDVMALIQEYQLFPTIQAVSARRMLRRALAGDTEAAIFLFSMSYRAGEIQDMIREGSIWNAFFGDSEKPGESRIEIIT